MFKNMTYSTFMINIKEYVVNNTNSRIYMNKKDELTPF